MTAREGDTLTSETATEVLTLPAEARTGPTRIGMYTLGSALVQTFPLPWLPASVDRRIRGALVYEVTARHGISLSPEAREVLAAPTRTGGKRRLLQQVATFAAFRTLGRFGPLGFVPPLRGALMTFALAHLLERYLESIRSEKAVRIDVSEARALRYAIDASVLRALSVEGKPMDRPRAPEETRDASTQITDAVLNMMAGLPAWLIARIEAAFDELAPRTRG